MAAKSEEKNWLAWEEGDLFSPKLAAAAMDRMDAHIKRLRSSLLHNRMQLSWRMYYSRGENGLCDDSMINLKGDKGEIVSLRPATYRRLIQDRVAMVQQTPPDYEPHALNTDATSQAQCALALGILDYYKRVAHLEELGVQRFEMSSVMASSYFHVRWDPQAGKPKAVDPGAAQNDKQATKSLIYEGDLTFRVGSEYDTAYDRSSPDPSRPRWWIVREPVNRWDLLAQFGADSPEIEQAIRSAEPFSAFARDFGFDHEICEFDDSIAVYWVYGEACPSVEQGRKALVLNEKIVLADGPLDEDRAGVFPLWPSRVLLRAEGHTNNFGGMAVASAYASQLTTIISNQAAYGLGKLLVDKKSAIITSMLNSGLMTIDWDSRDATGAQNHKPEMLDQQSTTAEHFRTLDVLDRLQDKAQGGSGVLRGDDAATKGDSGSKAALLLAQAQQIGAGDVRAKIRSDEEVATFIISSVRRHAKVERVIAIAGKANSFAAREFKGEDLSQIDRVSVRQPNPARDTFAGRMGMAELLKDLEPDQREQMQQLLLTGRLESLTEEVDQHRIMIDRENEALRDPAKPPPKVRKTDKHLEHIKRHLPVMDGQDIRDDDAAAARIEQHIADHVAALMPADAQRYAGTELLMVTGQQPLPDPRKQGQPEPDADNAKGAKPPGAHPGKPPDAKPANGAPGAGDMPSQPKMPMNPATGERIEVGGANGSPAPQVAGP